MAGLFSIFNESENNVNLSLNKGNESQSLATSKLKSLGNAGFKPKGLSIRSKSELNISCSNNSESNKLNSNDYMKSQVNLSNKQSTMPIKSKMTKSKSFANIIGKKLSPTISSPIMQNVVDNFVFRKPETPKPQKKQTKCPEPENLYYYFDQYKYMTEEMESIFDEDRRLLKSARKLDDSMTSLEDEGFISGSEFDSFEFQTEISLLQASLSDVELPEISDFED